MRRLWRRLFGPRPLSGDWCSVCFEDLRRGHVYELRVGHEIDDETGGGTFLAATYCAKHAPADATRT